MGSLLLFINCCAVVLVLASSKPLRTYRYSNFTETVRSQFIIWNGNINYGALQVTPETADIKYSMVNESGRVLLRKSFRLWKKSSVASFNASFVFKISPIDGKGGEGIAFIITSAIVEPPEGSYGPYLGLFNAATDGNTTNRLVAVEFDTKKSIEGDDPDGNHVGINVNSMKSLSKASVTPRNIILKSKSDVIAWIQYDGEARRMFVYVDAGSVSNLSNPLLSVSVDLSVHLGEEVYFGFSGSTGKYTELNCIRSWNLTVENLQSGKKRGSIIGLAVGLPLLIIALLGFGIAGVQWRRRHRNKKSIRFLERALTDSSGGPRKFRLKELRKGTHNFDRKYMLGEGGFGSVYKGYLANKTLVAVKRISENSHQGEQEFIAEAMIISKLRHKNLVRLLGWCHEHGELLLVYDLMPNGSLDKWIFEIDAKREVLDWNRRYKIVCGVAFALLYLHEECEHQVLHRDLKANNVMLDSDYNARLGDFGLARVIERDKNSYTTTAVSGTPGYIAPECFHTGRATTESDVFSFGAVALEVACGRRPRTESQTYLVDWVWALYREGRLLDAADARLLEKFDMDEMKCMLLLGMACSHPHPQERPSMRQALQILTKHAPPPFLPLFKPAFVWPAPPSSIAGILPSFSVTTTQ